MGRKKEKKKKVLSLRTKSINKQNSNLLKMKISHEVKIGFVVFVILAMFIWAYNFMKGRDILSSSVHYYV
ncbi:MAG: hypothetical protein KAT38_10090, partial [Bacteroidales bacterium]|nr:hypothetical protein [Bacteroidales bacterium]